MNSALQELVDALRGLQIGDNQKRAHYEERLAYMRDQEGFVNALVSLSNDKNQVTSVKAARRLAADGGGMSERQRAALLR